MKILIAIPSMDQVPARFAQSLATLKKVGDCQVAFQIGSLIYKAREDLAITALKLNADYVLWLDSDMVFDSDILEKMMATMETKNIDILSGLYCRRVAPFKPIIFDELEITDEGCKHHNQDNIPTSITKVGGIGFGCVLMRTDVLLSVMGKFETMFSPIGGVGEDLSFCWRARECGYEIYLDPSISLGHVGHTIVTKELYEAYRGAEDA